MIKFNYYHRKIREAIRLAAPRALDGVARLFWLVVLIAFGWFFYHNFAKKEVPPSKISWIEDRSVPLLDAMEKYHAAKGLYPKLLRDLGVPPNEYGLDFMYEGSDREFVMSDACVEMPNADACWKGYRRYRLIVVQSGKTYEYSSGTRRWTDQSPSVAT